MTKKGSFFKLLLQYFQGNILGSLGWLWVAFMPVIGSSFLLYSYKKLAEIHLTEVEEFFIFTTTIGLVLGIALLPTTLTSLACGFFWGWSGFIPLVIGYILANVLGYTIGKRLNSGFFDRFFTTYPELSEQIQSKIHHPGQLIFFIRISPVIPFAISNFLFASLQVPLKKVLTYGIPGMLPRTMLAFGTGMVANSFLGAKEALGSPSQIILMIILFLSSGIGIYRQIRRK